jgi:hypothetical protein
MPERQVRALELPARLGSRPVVIDPLLLFATTTGVAAVQRKEPVESAGFLAAQFDER